jgi:assimilatory nitrate reductase catalytic subunit
VREALGKLELFVVSENVLSNDTVNAGAHVLLPAAAWGEKDGTVTNSERRISRQRVFLPLPGEAKPDWQIVAEVAGKLGFADAFAYRSAADVSREHAALSGFENGGTRDFDIGSLATLSDADYDVLAPVQWPAPQTPSPSLEKGGSGCRRQSGEGSSCAPVSTPTRQPSAADLPLSRGGEDKRFFADGGFFTPDRKGRFIATEPPALKEATSPDFPLRLNTGRIRDQWHTMTRTGMSPRLATHLPEPFVEVHPDDAANASLVDGGFARVATAHGACIVKVVVTEDQQPGSIFLPIHWSGDTASCARADDLVSACTDPHSGQPEAKATPASIAPVVFAMRGLVRTHRPVVLPNATWWTRVAAADGHEYRIATDHGPLMWHDFAYRMLAADAKLAEYLDPSTYRAEAIVDGEVDGFVWIGPSDQPLSLELGTLDVHDDSVPLAQIAAISLFKTEPVVCACFGIGAGRIRNAVTSGTATTVAEIGKATQAGTNCGSCLPELKRMIAQERAKLRTKEATT